MTPIQTRIGMWHRRTFPNCSQLAIEAKFAEEADEFTNHPSGEEAADVVIVVMAWCEMNGVDLYEAVLAKFEKIQSRDQLSRDIERGIPHEVQP